MRLYVDRISDDFTVCETEEQTFLKLPLDLMPQGAKEGSVLFVENGKYVLDVSSEQKRRREIFELQNRLFDRDDP